MNPTPQQLREIARQFTQKSAWIHRTYASNAESRRYDLSAQALERWASDLECELTSWSARGQLPAPTKPTTPHTDKG